MSIRQFKSSKVNFKYTRNMSKRCNVSMTTSHQGNLLRISTHDYDIRLDGNDARAIYAVLKAHYEP